MASVRKDESGRWRCQVRKKGYPPQGRTFDSKAEAVAWGVQVEGQMNRAMYVVPDQATKDMTVADLLDRYVQEEAVHKASESDDKQRAETVKRELGAFGVTEVTNPMLSAYKRNRLLVRAPQTVTHELNLLHRAYVVGVQDWGLILPSGIPKTSRPKLPEGRERRVTQAEIDLILANTDSIELGYIVTLAVESAMRRGEIVGLTWDRVNLEARTLFIAHTKTDAPRTIPLSTKAVQALMAMRKDYGKVFAITGRCASQAFKRAVDRAGLEDLHFHDLRHEATTRLFELGLNVLEVASITGHKNLKMLERYTHLEAGRLVARLD